MSSRNGTACLFSSTTRNQPTSRLQDAAGPSPLEERESWHRAIPTLQLPFYIILHAAETGQGPCRNPRHVPAARPNPRWIQGIELPLFEEPAAVHESWPVLERVIRDLLQEIVSPDVPFSPAAGPARGVPPLRLHRALRHGMAEESVMLLIEPELHESCCGACQPRQASHAQAAYGDQRLPLF